MTMDVENEVQIYFLVENIIYLLFKEYQFIIEMIQFTRDF